MRWPTRWPHCNHSKKQNSNHLSVHQWIRSAIRDSQQPSSPIVFLFWKFRHRLVRYYWYLNGSHRVFKEKCPSECLLDTPWYTQLIFPSFGFFLQNLVALIETDYSCSCWSMLRNTFFLSLTLEMQIARFQDAGVPTVARGPKEDSLSRADKPVQKSWQISKSCFCWILCRLNRLRALSEKQDMQLQRQLRQLRPLGAVRS